MGLFRFSLFEIEAVGELYHVRMIKYNKIRSRCGRRKKEEGGTEGKKKVSGGESFLSLIKRTLYYYSARSWDATLHIFGATSQLRTKAFLSVINK